MSGIISQSGGGRFKVVIVALAAITMSTTLAAQSLPVDATTNFALLPYALDTTAAGGLRNPNRLKRAMVGGLAGAVTLGFAGYLVVGGCTTKCDVLEWDEVIIGGLVGAMAGSTIGAAAPHGRGSCTTEQRYGTALGGAFLGTLGALVLAQLPYSRPGVIVTIPLGSVMFMGGC